LGKIIIFWCKTKVESRCLFNTSGV
jgi:hypothetical protein